MEANNKQTYDQWMENVQESWVEEEKQQEKEAKTERLWTWVSAITWLVIVVVGLAAKAAGQ